MGCYVEVPPLQEIASIPDEGYAPFYFPSEGGVLLFKFTDETFTRVLSALRNGAYMSYGDQARQVIWDFLQNVEYPMEICEQIINCIINDEATRAALAEAIFFDENIGRAIDERVKLGSPLSEGQLNLPLNDNGSGCDKDVVFAEVTGIVDQMHQNNLDFLEIMSAASTPGKRLAQIITAIPVLETLPADDIIAYTAKIYDEIVVNYNAQWTTALRDQIRCDLFCLAQEDPDCKLSYDDIFWYFNQRLGNAVSVGNLVGSVVQYTILGTWSGSTVVDIMMLNQVAIWRAASNWLGVDIRTLQVVTRLASNYPDPDWIILCETCDELICLDFYSSEAGANPYPNSLAAQYNSGGGGWSQSGAGGVALILNETDIPMQIERVIVRFLREWTGDTDFDAFYGQVQSATGTAGTVTFGQGLDPLRTGSEVIVSAPAGTYWSKGDLIVALWAGGSTWPDTPFNSEMYQGVVEICVVEYTP